MKVIFGTLLVVILGFTQPAVSAQSQNELTNNRDVGQVLSDFRLPTLRESANVDERTIGIAYANQPLLHEAMLELDAEMARLGGSRIVPVVSDNQLQSLYDLLFLRGIDAALINSDVVSLVAGHGGYDKVRNLVGSLASIDSDVLIFAAQEQINSIADLTGKVIALDEQSPENQLSTSLVMNALGIEARYRRLSHSEVFNSLQNGTVDAALISLRASDSSTQMEIVSGTQRDTLALLDGLNILPIPMNSALSKMYSEVPLTHDELTGLIDPAASVSALRRSVVLAAYRWRQSNPRREDLVDFTEAFLNGTKQLSSPDGHNVWANVEFDAETPGIQRLDIYDSVLELTESRKLAEELAEEARMKELLTRQIEGESAALLARLSDESNAADALELQRLLNELEVFLVSLKQ